MGKMGPTKPMEVALAPPSLVRSADRPRRGSLPELKSAEKKVPTGPRANPLYKTRLCMNFQTTGSCPYTEKCQFAHGLKELEKWEAWRNSHKGDDSQGPPPDEPRSRSSSMDKSRRGSVESIDALLDMPISQSPQDSNFEMSTPVMSSVSSVLDEAPGSLQSDFSLWSASLESLTTERQFRPELRGRAATYDATYDNISQLSDAPTLFTSPPVLPSLGRLSFN